MAVAGLVLGYVSLLVTTGIWVTWFAAFSGCADIHSGPSRTTGHRASVEH